METYKPHEYQDFATQLILDKPAVGLFLQMGLGKTVSTLTAIDRLLYDSYEADKVLVIAPLRVADDTWDREVKKWEHLCHLKVSKVLGSQRDRIRALNTPADIYTINRENVEWLVTRYGSKWPFDTVVIDELSSFKSPRSRRFRALKKVRPLMKRVVGLTGTPAPNSLMDLWSEMYLLDQGERLGKTITGYRDRYFVPGQRQGHVVFNWREKEEAEARIYEAISDITVSMKAEDWLELPDRVDIQIPVTLSPEARELYKQLERDLLIPYRDADVVAQTAAVLSNKLLQMASGAVYDEEHGIKHIHDAKLDALGDIIEAACGHPVMVAYNFRHSLARIQERFPQARVLGKGTDDIKAWNNDEIPLLCVHPKSAGHGLNLQDSSCQTIVWFDQIWSLEEYQQLNARIYRQGQTRKITVANIIAEDTMDTDAAAAIDRKAAGQDALMEAVKARISKQK